MQGKLIAVLGLAFKAGTDDIRESPALCIVKALLEEGARLRVHDPQAMKASKRDIPPRAGRLEYSSSAYEAARDAHALLVLTPWQEYRDLNWPRLYEVMEVPAIVDATCSTPKRCAPLGLSTSTWGVVMPVPNPPRMQFSNSGLLV